MKVHILPAALADLDDIDSYLIENFGVRRANEAHTKLFETFSLLSEFPNLGHPRPDITLKPVRFFHLKPCWIVYEAAGQIIVHRVYHASRKPQL